MKRFVSLLILLSLFSSVSLAQEMPVPVDIQYQLLLKILTFDRNLHSRTGDTLVIGIVHQKYFRTSLNVKEELMQIFDASDTPEIDSIPVACVPLPIQTLTGFDSLLAQTKIDIIYIAPLRGVDVSTLASICQSRNIVTFSGVPEYMDYGATIALDTQGDNPKILINLNAAKKIGVNFNSQLLKLSKIIE